MADLVHLLIGDRLAWVQACIACGDTTALYATWDVSAVTCSRCKPAIARAVPASYLAWLKSSTEESAIA